MTLSSTSQHAKCAAGLALLLALVGCSQTRTVTVPAGQSTINAEIPDTSTAKHLPEAPPAPATKPEEVVVYADTSHPTFDVSLVEVDRTDPDDQGVRIRVKQGTVTVEKRFALPVVGEGLRVSSESHPSDTASTNRPRDTPLEETVFGAPIDYETEARARSIEPPWWTRLWAQVRLALAFFGGVVFGYVATKLIPGL